MSGQTQRTLTLFLALGTISLLSGCIWLAAGAVGALYVGGELKATVVSKPPKVVEATDKAFEQMSIVKVSSRSTALDGEVIGRMATDKKVTVTVKSEGEKASRILIRIGTFGDKNLSQQILDKIKSNL